MPASLGRPTCPTGLVTAAVVRSGVVAVLRAPTADGFAAVADVLVEAGITAIEVTLTSRGAIDALAGLRRQLPPSAVVGAGTVLTADDAKAAVDAGAAFLVSPLLDPALGGGFGVPFYPGGLTPTEMFTAHRAGAPLVKLFPAATVGPRYLKDLHGPLPDVRIMPTGGIDIGDIATWLGTARRRSGWAARCSATPPPAAASRPWPSAPGGPPTRWPSRAHERRAGHVRRDDGPGRGRRHRPAGVRAELPARASAARRATWRSASPASAARPPGWAGSGRTPPVT